jgi:hypothetical protein
LRHLVNAPSPDKAADLGHVFLSVEYGSLLNGITHASELVEREDPTVLPGPFLPVERRPIRLQLHSERDKQ